MVGALYLTPGTGADAAQVLREGDWAASPTMAIGLSALPAVLEEGNKDDWFASPFIRASR